MGFCCRLKTVEAQPYGWGNDMPISWIFPFRLVFTVVMLCHFMGACKMKPHTDEPVVPLREVQFPSFDPHIAEFACKYSATLPPLDAEADVWFMEARALENPEIFHTDIDYKKIVALTKKAADRHHWKAMLNLASLYVEGRDAGRGEKEAVDLVEKAMGLGIPAAYDRMGTYYLNGTGVNQDSTHAYALFRKAAEMGSPESMAFLGEKLLAAEDRPSKGWWANVPVGLQMLSCAISHGYGGAAWDLAAYYRQPIGRKATVADKALALRILHDGVRLGGMTAARSLMTVFRSNRPSSYDLVPPDVARRERYSQFTTALEFDPSDRFPNLDRVLPLPPAELPPWNGDRDTLLAAARGITAPAPVSTPTVYSQRTGRFFLESAFLLEETDYTTTDLAAPFAGYWKPHGVTATTPSTNAELLPGLYQVNETFDRVRSTGASSTATGSPPPQWKYYRTVHNPPHMVRPLAPAKMTTVRPRPLPLVARGSDQISPKTGIWQPWVADTHPLNSIINQPWRQAWIKKGQGFPVPERDWFLKMRAEDITWHLMDDSSVDIHSPPKPPDGKERAVEK